MSEARISTAGRVFLILTGVLVVLGIVMLSSAGIVDAERRFGSPYYYVWHQILFGVLPGVIAFYILSKINYLKWRTLALPLLLVAIVLMVLVFIPGLGILLNGARRWIDVGPVTFQPAEFLKLALIIYLAAWFSGKYKQSQEQAYALVPFILILVLIVGLLILQPDLGTLGLIIGIALAVYFFSGAPIKHLLILFLIGCIGLGVMAVASPYRFNRIKTFLDPTADTRGSSYHINQALIGIGSGGMFGVGFAQSQQKFKFLPEPVGDSIFAIVVEELGMVGGLVLVGLFIALTVTMIKIAHGVSDEFGRLLVIGIAVWIIAQAFINIAAITGLMPLTGLPLPFISYGSSSLVMILASLGIVLNVARNQKV